MAYLGFTLVIFGLLIRMVRDPLGREMLWRIEDGTINDANRHKYRHIWMFFMRGWQPIIFLGIGLIITKIITT